MKHEIGIAPIRKGLVWAVGFASFMTLLDFLDDDTSNFEAAVYFPSTYACATLSLYLTAYFLRSRSRYRSFSVSREALTVLVASLPTTVVVLLLDLYVNPDLGQDIAEAPHDRTVLIIASFIESYLESTLFLAVLWFFVSNAGRRGEAVEAAVSGLDAGSSVSSTPAEEASDSPSTSLGQMLEPNPQAAPSTEDRPAEAALVARFPKLQGHEIRALEAQEHYVKVYTDKTEELVLYRFADAIKDVEGLSGLQVHRSFWVACEAVTSARRDGRKVKLVLRDGLEIPVSKTYRPAAEAAGLINF